METVFPVPFYRKLWYTEMTKNRQVQKMKKNLIWIGIIVVIVLLIGALVGIRFWFEQPGIQVLGNQIHVEMNEIGYIIDSKTEEIIGQTPVSIEGATSIQDKTKFDGDLTVLGYPNIESGTVEATTSVERLGSGFYAIDCVESCTHSETENGVTKVVEHICDYMYTYYLYPENENFLIVKVKDLEKSTVVYVVCAENEDQAMENYAWFLENCPA